MAKRAKKRKAPVAGFVPPIVEQVKRDMRDSWRKDDLLLDKFFSMPEPAPTSPYYRAQKECFNARSKRWKGISATPSTLSRIHTPLTNLMNRILFHYGISRTKRLFMDTHVRRHGAGSISLGVTPGILLSGIGDEFANLSANLPCANFPAGIAPFEVCLDSDDLMAARDRLAVHMHRIFQSQVNRRFAYGIVITQNIFIAYMFDHSGAVASEPCNYHAHPDRFCAVVSGLASENEIIGFDTTILGYGAYIKIRTYEPDNSESETEMLYTIKAQLFRFPSLVGRGTLIWRALGPDNQKYVVKDAWIGPSEFEGKESEGSLLRHAQTKGVVTGIAQIRHFEEVRRSADASDLDTILRNRCLIGTSPEERKLERAHIRIVMRTYGKPLDHFSSKMELILAFHDAVLGHRRLHEVAGILHRDISIRNILINREGVEGDRGILIDFDHSIRTDDTSPYSAKTKIGTWRYMSRNVLNEEGPHTYLDDLESFFYVLCWILASFKEPGRTKKRIPDLVALWDTFGSPDLKHGHFMSDFAFPVERWFGDCFRDLAASLFRFFRRRRKFIGKPLSALNPQKDYDDFLSPVRQCIADIEKESRENDQLSDLGQVAELPHGPDLPRKRPRVPDDEQPRISKRRHPTLSRPMSPPAPRPRRSTADYGEPS